MNYKPLYTDTDSAPVLNDAIAAKQYLNSIYGVLGTKRTDREYISVIVDDNPTLIFKRNIISVAKTEEGVKIICVGNVVFYTKEDYVSIVKKIIG